MGMRINETAPGLMAARQADSAAKALGKTLLGLSSGRRINRAGDDAAGLAIAEDLQARVRQFTRESASLQSGISMVQTAEGGLAAQQEGVGRLRELALQAANGALNDDQRAALQEEARQVLEQIGATAEDVEFNGRQLLNGTAPTTDLGVEGGVRVEIAASRPADLGIEELDLSTREGAEAAVAALDAAAARISENRSRLGAQENRLATAVEVRDQAAEQLTEAESRIRDLDVAQATIDRSRQEMLLRASLGATAAGNVNPQMAARLLGQ